MENKMDQKISFDELPKMSPWPARLLGFEHWEQRTKSQKEVLREFNLERWKSIVDLIKNSHKSMTVADVDMALMADKKIAFFRRDEFLVGAWKNVHQMHIDLYTEVLACYRTADTSGLVELGAGYGSMILNLAHTAQLKDLTIFAGEFTENGIEALSLLSNNDGIKAKIGFCDLRERVLKNMDIPPCSIIFTSLASHYVPNFSQEFIDFFISLKPQAVIHFEPCFEHHQIDSIYGLMCRKYIEINDYNRNLLSTIHTARDLGKITLLDEQANVIGFNPFLPISVLAWKPIIS